MLIEFEKSSHSSSQFQPLQNIQIVQFFAMLHISFQTVYCSDQTGNMQKALVHKIAKQDRQNWIATLLSDLQTAKDCPVLVLKIYA